ncbi:RNA-binding protein 6 isoform X3 [Girardinichthys multiradiatus]|uniref:RNA-binding protein 6 isoform X3 n=1 Tax=Girardinichthys multiradiatus TaxID=208333 RepID=UPI001FADBD92|nr:RNA-binding protein 6 isoform X3 [Girardinichthys multiradiatus]
MWDGPGPRGRPPFRGDHRGEMVWGRDRPVPDYRDRDGMNMGHMGPRPFVFPLMDQRRMDGFPIRGHDMDPRDMRGRDPSRDFFIPGEEPDFHPRRHIEISIRDQIVDSPGFRGPGRDSGGRGLPPWEPNDRFSDMRDRKTFQYDRQRFDRPDVDGRRGFPMDRMERDDRFRDMPDRHPVDVGDADRYKMDLPPHERRLMDIDRRGGPPLNPRGRFESDTDFRNRPEPPVDLRDRDRSPLRFGPGEFPPAERERLDIPQEVVGRRPEFRGPGDTVGSRDYPKSSGSPLMDYRSGEEMTLAEEWKSRQKDKNPFLEKDLKGGPNPSFPVGLSSNVNVRDSSLFHERDRPRGDHFPAMDPPVAGKKGLQDPLMPETTPLTGHRNRENKEWPRGRDPKYVQNKTSCDERPPYLEEQNKPSLEIKEPNDPFREIKDVSSEQIPFREKLGEEDDFQRNSTIQARDQDYRDIDYRTAPRRVFDYKHEELPPTEKFLKNPNPITPSKFTDSGSQDRDYRNASVKDKVSNIISICDIPKTDSVDQILGALAVSDGVPMQGMKIRSVVPGYSYDMAYVEFLNLEDAVHFMESNKGSIKVGTRTSAMKYVQPNECERDVLDPDHRVRQTLDSQLPKSEPLKDVRTDQNAKGSIEELFHSQFQRNTDLTPEAWQQQVDQQHQQEQTEQLAGSSHNCNPLHISEQPKSVFKDSKTMIIKNLKSTTTVETILKALDPFAYLDERNVRLVKGKPPGTKCFCFVDMDSNEQVKRLVELITKPRPLYIDGVKVHAEIARPLKNQNLRRDYDTSNPLMVGHPSEDAMMAQSFPPPPQYLHPVFVPIVGSPATDVAMQVGDLMTLCTNPVVSSNTSLRLGMDYVETTTAVPAQESGGLHVPTDSAELEPPTEESQAYICGSEPPDTSSYLYDSTSGFYYDPDTTLYYDPNSRYFYNAQTQEYLYWDGTSKNYISVPGGSSAGFHPAPTMTAEDRAILSNPAADAPLEMKKPSAPPEDSAALVAGSAESCGGSVQSLTAVSEKKEDEESPKKDKEKDSKDEKPRGLAAVKIMKDMERWAKIQNRQKETVRAPSPVLKSGIDDGKRQSKSADAAFAIFERKITGSEDLFKKPLAPIKKEEKSKRPMGSLGLLASDYGAGSDEEVEEDKEEAAKSTQKSQPEEKDRLTDWKKMACLLCRRQFPNKDALIRHQQLSDLHKQNMEIHLKIKKSKKELEALEHQEQELSARETSRSPEQKRRKQHHQQLQQHSSWAGSSREANKGSERPGLGAEPVQKRKKEPVVWDHNSYKQAVRKAMFARFKELE